LAGFGSGIPQGVAQGKRPIVQTIAASQPTRVVAPVVFHPSANPEREPSAISAPVARPPVDNTLRADARPPARTAPVARGPLDVSSGLGDETASPRRANNATTSSKKPVERSRKRASARFGQSEIVDPWSAKR
jgi:hypothetical protein